MNRPIIRLAVIIALIQLATVFFMILLAARGHKQAEEILEGMQPPLTIEVWHRWATPLIALPLVWISAVVFASAEDRSPKTAVLLVSGGLVITISLIIEAIRLLGWVLYLSTPHRMSG